MDIPGHRTDVRTLCLSSNDQMLASASNGAPNGNLDQQISSHTCPGSLKIWNMKTTQCIRTIECGYAICSTFLPGDRHVGHVLLFLCLTILIIRLDRRWNKNWRDFNLRCLVVHPD